MPLHPGSILRGSIATFLLSASAFLAGTANSGAQINFTIPADAPDGGFGTVGILEVTGVAGCCGDQDQARNALLSGGGTRLTGQASLIDFHDSGGTGQFGLNRPFLSDPNPAFDTDTVNNIAIIYRGTINIPTTGVYTFGVNSDDGFTLAFDNGASSFMNVFGDVGNDGAGPDRTALTSYNGFTNGAMTFFGGRGTADSLGSITLTAGNHPFVLTFHEGGGGSAVEFFAAAGEQTSFNSSFQLVGAPAQTFQRKLTGVGDWDYVRINGSDSLDAAIARYNNNNPTGSFLRTTVDTINFHDPQGSNTGGKAPAVAFPGDTGVDDDNFGGAGRVTLELGPNDLGIYTFLIYADDSTRFRIFDQNQNLVPILSIGGGAGNTLADTNGDSINDAFRTTGCCSDAFGKWNLTTAGTYTLEAIFNEQGGGAGFFVYGAAGDHNGFSPAFQLVGENRNETVTTKGLDLVPEPASTGMVLLGAAAMLGLRRRRS